MTAALGTVVIVFALIGVSICLYTLIRLGVSTAKNYAAPKENEKYFENYLSLVAGLDPAPYSNLQSASDDWKLKTAVWAAVWEDNNVRSYGVTDDDRKIVPGADVGKYYDKYFGDSVKPLYHSFTDNGINFDYDPKLNNFYVPEKAVIYVFTPKVTNINRNGSNITLTVQYLPSSGWSKKADGTLVQPAPIKTMRYILSGSNGSYVIKSIKNVASATSSSSKASGASSASGSSSSSSSSQ